MKRLSICLAVLAVLTTSGGCHVGTWGWLSRASQPVSFMPTKWGSGEPVFKRVSRDGRSDDAQSRQAYGIRDGEPWDMR